MKAKVRIVSYGEDQINIDSIRLTVLRIIGEKYIEEPIDLGDNPEETLEKIAVELGEGSYVEAIAEAKNQVIRVGRSRTDLGSSPAKQAIFYRPSKLLRIGVLRSVRNNGQNIGLSDSSAIVNAGNANQVDQVEGLESGSIAATDQGTLSIGLSELSDIEWYYPQGEFYVFEGDLRIDGECEAVVIVTEDGEKIHFVRASGMDRAVVMKKARTTAKRRKKKGKKKARGS
ncbi:hypothetical protein ATG_18150 [Desulfurococcaceae archaeon AG1]|nr:MAG: hypothetical protein DJ555_04275 [Desulfurococcaceae archaeon]GAY26611.1 hypothetical protein ATG_18150 [Desulfurococcaceae archaeon AG1]